MTTSRRRRRWWNPWDRFAEWAWYAGHTRMTLRMGLCNAHECGCLILCNTVQPRKFPDFTPELLTLARAKGGRRDRPGY